MPLGLAKDSMLNLAELAHKKEEEEEAAAAAGLSDTKTTTTASSSIDGENEESLVDFGELEIEPVNDDGDDDSPDSNNPNPSAAPMVTGDKKDNAIDDNHNNNSNDKDEGNYSIAEATSSSATTPGKSVSTATSASISSTNTAKINNKNKNNNVSNPNTPRQASTATSYGQYSGFSPSYEDYQQFQYSGYSGYTISQQQKPFVWNGNQQRSQNGVQGLLCCLFPWLNQPKDDNDDDEDGLMDSFEQPLAAAKGSGQKSTIKSLSGEDDEVSTGSDALGEKLSDKDRQAVLARLRLAQPDAGSPGSPSKSEKGLLNGIVGTSAASANPDGSSATPNSKKGILRRPSTLSRMNSADMSGYPSQGSGLNSGDKGKGSAGGASRRSLFPQYGTTQKSKKNLKVDFSPMARVVSVKSKNEMSEREKGDIWWQKSDYEEFRKTGRMITKAMLEGGSEIWLASNQSWQTPNQNKKSTLQNAIAMTEQHARDRVVNRIDKANVKRAYESTRDKWWHKFGHSRRGLEHIASIDEGRQRQANVRIAIRAVVEEQRRQKVFHREDAEKLRMVSIQYTSWARDLALAAGASDANAVEANFEENRKSREFYLLKFSRSKPQTNAPASTNRSIVPAFMQPTLSLASPTNKLDANTISQIRYRQTKVKMAAQQQGSSSTNKVSPTSPQEDNETETAVSSSEAIEHPIHDPDPSKNQVSMAKKAAGFASGEEVANMSAVLSGMGAVPKKPATATAGGP